MRGTNTNDDSNIDPREHVIDFNHVALIMNSMGFLNNKSSNEQEQELEDMYTLLK